MIYLYSKSLNDIYLFTVHCLQIMTFPNAFAEVKHAKLHNIKRQMTAIDCKFNPQEDVLKEK